MSLKEIDVSPETRKIALTAKHFLTLSQLTHDQLVMAISAVDPAERHSALKPPPMQGYTHELAMENSSGYREQWAKYEAAIRRDNVFIWIGAAWQAAWLDMEGDSWKREIESAIGMGEKFGLPKPNQQDVVEMGGLAYALIERRNSAMIDELILWLREGAGLLDTSAVEAERKSPEGDGERPAHPGSQPGDAAENQERRQNPRNRGG